jgi:hypothetical protein
VSISDGDATLSLKVSKLRNKAITIVYGGDTNFQPTTATPPVLTQSGLKGLARPMLALLNRGRMHRDLDSLVTQGQRPLTCCSSEDFQHEIVAPPATAAFHGYTFAARMLLQQ